MIGRRDFLKVSGLAAIGAIAGGCLESDLLSGVGGKKPNLVFVFPDQMRGQAMGFLGEERVITPNLDRFASESLVLPQTVSNYPVCSPFRAMLMTGKYPHANKVTSNCNTGTSAYNCELQESDVCWSDVLKGKGYSLGYIGKWHLDSPYKPYIKCKNNSDKFAWNEWCSPDRRHGFDYWHAYGTYDYHTRPMYWSTDAGRQDFHYVDQWGPIYETDRAVEFIENKNGKVRPADKPFALVVSMNPPHMPYKLVPQRYVDMYKDVPIEDICDRPSIPAADTKMGKYYRNNIKYYYGMITGVDEQFGRILETLKQQGLDDNTIVVFTSDHGNCLGIHDKVSKNNRYEESMRVPFIIRYPGRIAARRDEMLFSGLDMCPTLIDLTVGKGSIPAGTDGVSFAKQFLTGKGEKPKWQWYMWTPPEDATIGRRGIRNTEYTFVVSKVKDKANEYYLHDNVNDPYQMENIAAENPALVKELTVELDKMLRKYDDPWLKTV